MPETLIEKPIKYTDKQTAFILLRKEGYSIKNASNAVGYSSKYGYQLESKLRVKDLTGEYWLKDAAKAVKNIVKGKKFGDIDEIKASTTLEAAKMIYDRVQPIVHRSESLTLNADLGFVDLSRYRRLDSQSSGQAEETKEG